MIQATAAILSVAAPFFDGFWNIETQIFFPLSFILLFLSCLSLKTFKNRIPGFFVSPPAFNLLAVAVIVSFSFLRSPLRYAAGTEFFLFLSSFALIALGAVFGGRGEKVFYFSYKVSVAVFLACALAEAAFFGKFPPSAFFENSNAMALFFLMFVPLAFERGDRVFAASAGAGIILSGSLGGMLALSLLILFAFGKKLPRKYLFTALFLLALAAFAAADLKSVTDRITWWKDAWNIFAARPLFGWGYSAVTFVFPSFHSPVKGGLSSIYAHNYFLEFLAENGIFAFLLWMFFIFSRIGRNRGFKKFSVMAAMVHSFVDFGLSRPALMWIFSLILGLCLTEENDYGESTLKNGKYFSLVLVLLLLGALRFSYIRIKCENLAREAEYSRSFREKMRLINEMKNLDFTNPAVHRLEALTYMEIYYHTRNPEALFRSAESYEKVLFLNPYDYSAYTSLEIIYGKAGEKKLSRDLIRRKAEILFYAGRHANRYRGAESVSNGVKKR